MRAKIGDVVIDKTYNKKGNLAIVVGEGISQPILIDHKGGITMDKLRDYFAVWDELEVIGHIDLEKVWEEAVLTADRKTENNSEKPNNCKDLQDWKDRMWAEAIVTEPTISKMEQVEDEPKTQMKTQNSNLTFEKRKCIDCNFLTYMFGKTWCNIKCENPHDKVCDRFKPKDEPQTDCAWK